MITHDLRLIADAIIDKKGENVVSLDLRKMDGAITDRRATNSTVPRVRKTISGSSRTTGISWSTCS